MALAGALCQTLLAATSFTSKNLRVLIAGLLGSAYTKVYNRLLVPLTAADQPQTRADLRAALAAITRHVDDYATGRAFPAPRET